MLNMKIKKKLKTSYCIRVSGDNRFLCHNMGSKTIVYDFNSWEKIVELTKPKHPNYMRFSNNNKYLLVKSTTGTICIYETTNFQLIKTIPSNKKFKIVEGDLNCTQDGLMILDAIETNDGQQISSINMESGKCEILTEFENSMTMISYNQFVSSENSHLFTMSYVNKKTNYREYNIIKITEPIKKESIELLRHPEIFAWEAVIFDAIHNVYLLVAAHNEIFILDSEFKTVLRKGYVEGLKRTSYFKHIHLSNNGKYIVITYNDSIYILRYEDLTTILVESIPYACFAEFSRNDQYLLVGTWENGYILENNLLS